MSTVAVYVHGLWLNGWEGSLLCHRVGQQLGCRTRQFPYPSVSSGMAANVAALGRFLADIPADTLHLVGHSMGGLLILELFEQELALPPGRVVLLGSPVRGSQAAQNLARLPLGRQIMGAMAAQALLTPRDYRWSGARELGTVAGNFAFGLGGLVGHLEAPNDGTVLVEETQLPGATDHRTMHVSHTGLVLSQDVARQTAAFLQHGRFDSKPNDAMAL